MSAFLVSKDCINCIVSYMHERPDEFSWLNETLGYKLTLVEEAQRLAQALFDMNCDAITARYGAKALISDLSSRVSFAFKPVKRTTEGVHKAANCLAYQCTEGDIPDRPLHKALETVIDLISVKVNENSADYKAAPWGD